MDADYPRLLRKWRQARELQPQLQSDAAERERALAQFAALFADEHGDMDVTSLDPEGYLQRLPQAVCSAAHKQSADRRIAAFRMKIALEQETGQHWSEEQVLSAHPEFRVENWQRSHPLESYRTSH